MSVNRYSGHFQPGPGEFTIHSVKDEELIFKDSSHSNAWFKKSSPNPGVIHLTNKRFGFVSKAADKASKYNNVKDFSSCFGSISKVNCNQPMFGANDVTGTSSGEPGPDSFQGTVDWKLVFKSG